MTQRAIVENRINKVGYVDNFFAIENYILRLGAICCQLRKDGWELKGSFGKELGKDERFHKNYYYVLEKKGQGELI